jgi:hypothetical protein
MVTVAPAQVSDLDGRLVRDRVVGFHADDGAAAPVRAAPGKRTTVRSARVGRAVAQAVGAPALATILASSVPVDHPGLEPGHGSDGGTVYDASVVEPELAPVPRADHVGVAVGPDHLAARERARQVRAAVGQHGHLPTATQHEDRYLARGPAHRGAVGQVGERSHWLPARGER